MPGKILSSVFFAAFMAISAPAFAGPIFESVTFGKQSTHCNVNNTLVNIVPSGDGISFQFDSLQARSEAKARDPEKARCDISLKLVGSLQAPKTIRAGISGLIQLTGKGGASASISLDGHKQRLRFDAKDADGYDRVTFTLPKGANKLDISLEAIAQSEIPDSTALMAIDSLDVEIEQEK